MPRFFWLFVFLSPAISSPAAAPSVSARETLRKHCFSCHGKAAVAGLNLEQIAAAPSVGEHFTHWEKVIRALEEKRMPPAKMPQPTAAQRSEILQWLRGEMDTYATRHAGDPGRVTVRRLTNGEYAYSIQDLTSLDLNFARDFEGDSVGGEGFANFGDVQFVADANLERYLEAAKRVADHAVIGAGPLRFYSDPGKSGFELSAIARIQAIYRANGFRTVSGEGGRPYGLERYGKALYAAWRYRHRAALGDPQSTLAALAAHEQIPARFASHIWTVLHTPGLAHPSSEVVARWNRLPAPSPGNEKIVRAQCEEIQKYLTTWPSWLFARGDVAAGGAGDERPLEFSDESLAAKKLQPLRFVSGFRQEQAKTEPPKQVRIHLNAVPLHQGVAGPALIRWRNATVAFRLPGSRPGPASRPRQPLLSLLTPEDASQLKPDPSVAFIANGSTSFEIPLPSGALGVDLQIEAELAGDPNHVLRLTISDRADGGTRGVPVWALLGDPQSAGFRAWKAGVFEFARLLPPNSHSEPTPADKDPIPPPFDKVAYNQPERDAFIVKVKYRRDDRFVTENMLDPETRRQLDHAWSDLYASFGYHDAFLGLLADWYKLDLKGKRIATLTPAEIAALPEEPRRHIRALRAEWDRVQAEQSAAQPGHIEDTLRLASRAWRRPLTAAEQASLRAFYRNARANLQLDHAQAIRATLARVLVAPAFLYRLEAAPVSAVRRLNGWELATRLSYFLWSSLPDAELRRAAAAGELLTDAGLRKQASRLLADPKARRMATEFFGQWLGFYAFDQYRGVDTTRYPEFTDAVKSAMYDEAVSFFEHVIRRDRPVRELLHADYTFLNEALAKYYGVPRPIASKEEMEFVAGASAMHRGGMLRLGAVLTATSAPLRTSPVKRGDWLLRRVLGTPVPPPPADAGSIPADDKQFGGLSLRERLAVHKRNATCAGCHSRIDPLGFPLERYDSTGRWREQYSDGKPVDDAATLSDQREIAGVEGLLSYLSEQEPQVLRTLSRKLLGYALGRTVLLSDQPLLDRMTASGGATPFSTLVAEIVSSPQFRNRRAPEVSKP